MGLALLGGVAQATSSQDWPSYLLDRTHSSASGSSSVTVANAGTLTKAWSFVAAQPTMSGQPQRTFYASPTVAGNLVFIGSNTGVFYALSLSTGKVVWERFLGFQPKRTCGAIGLVSTAAVDTDPATGAEVVYVGGGDGYLYALNAVDGSVVWRSVVGQLPSPTVSDYFNWSSPAVANGKVYMGVASDCDNPFPPGGVDAFDQATGDRIATYYSVPGGGNGGGVWTSPAVSDAGDVWVTTGSGPRPPAPQGFMYSILHLDGSTLSQDDSWTVPVNQRPLDADFASSPTLFSTTLGGVQTPMVAACNKNGLLYAWQAQALASGPIWSTQVGVGTAEGSKACLAAPIWDGQHLFYASNSTSIDGATFPGSVRELDPATGGIRWETGLGGSIEGSPSINSSGVIAAAAFSGPAGGARGTFLVDSSDGSIRAFLPTTALEFSQPVFAGSYLLLANGGVLQAYIPRTKGDTTPPTEPSAVSAQWASDQSQANVSWNAANDNVGVSGYRIFRNGTMIATVAGDTTTYADLTGSPYDKYFYSVESVDAQGNVSSITSPTAATVASGLPVFQDGFETGTFGRWSSKTNVLTERSIVASGSWAGQISSMGATKSNAFTTFPASYLDLYASTRFYIETQGSNPVDLLGLRTVSGQPVVIVSANSEDRVASRTPNSGQRTSTTVVSPGSWHSITVHVTVNGASGTTAVWLDGQQIAKLSLVGNYGTTGVSQILIGEGQTGRTFTVDFDDVEADTNPIS